MENNEIFSQLGPKNEECFSLLKKSRKIKNTEL